MDNIHNFQTPSDREINISASFVFNCKINPEGLIDYANHQFCEISGYEEYELIGESMEILRHPDMPEIFFHILLDRLQKKEPMRLIAKFLAKDKRFFWLMIDFETKVDSEGNIIAHYCHSSAAPRYAVHKVSTLHKILSKIEEKTGDTVASKRYLIGFLEERNMNYNQYVEELSISHPEYERPFQQQEFSQRTSQNRDIDTHFNEMTFKSNADLLNTNKVLKNNKSPKKKSLLKKVFGK
jgi:PAS domain S-box-containing protein